MAPQENDDDETLSFDQCSTSHPTDGIRPLVTIRDIWNDSGKMRSRMRAAIEDRGWKIRDNKDKITVQIRTPEGSWPEDDGEKGLDFANVDVAVAEGSGPVSDSVAPVADDLPRLIATSDWKLYEILLEERLISLDVVFLSFDECWPSLEGEGWIGGPVSTTMAARDGFRDGEKRKANNPAPLKSADDKSLIGYWHPFGKFPGFHGKDYVYRAEVVSFFRSIYPNEYKKLSAGILDEWDNFVIEKSANMEKEFTFTLIWKFAQKIGWKYSKSDDKQYRPPQGSEIEGEPDFTSHGIVKYFKENKMLKREVLKEMFYEERAKTSKILHKKVVVKETISKTTRDAKEVFQSKKQKSFSAIEEGAEQYLSKRVKRGKRHMPDTEFLPNETDVNENAGDEILSERSEAPHSPLRCWKIEECIEEIDLNPFGDFKHVEELKALNDSFCRNFDSWHFQLHSKSLLLYGFGSKYDVLEKFAEALRERLDPTADVAVVDGHSEELTIGRLLEQMAGAVLSEEEAARLRTSGTSSSVTDISVRLGKAIFSARSGDGRLSSNNSTRPIYLLVHNIDGWGFRNTLAQSALSSLVAHSSGVIRLVGSVDHVNSVSLLWDLETKAKFDWIYVEVNSYQRYLKEVQKCSSHYDHKSKKFVATHAEKNSVKNVLSSLAPRHMRVMKEAVTAIREIKIAKATQPNDNIGSLDLSYKVLFEKCRAKCIIRQDIDMKKLLVELTDHGLILKKISGKTKEKLLSINLSPEDIQHILSSK